MCLIYLSDHIYHVSSRRTPTAQFQLGPEQHPQSIPHSRLLQVELLQGWRDNIPYVDSHSSTGAITSSDCPPRVQFRGSGWGILQQSDRCNVRLNVVQQSLGHVPGFLRSQNEREKFLWKASSQNLKCSSEQVIACKILLEKQILFLGYVRDWKSTRRKSAISCRVSSPGESLCEWLRFGWAAGSWTCRGTCRPAASPATRFRCCSLPASRIWCLWLGVPLKFSKLGCLQKVFPCIVWKKNEGIDWVHEL